jgi:hypothetical protein
LFANEHFRLTVVVAARRLGIAHFVRSRVPNARDRKLVAGEFFRARENQVNLTDRLNVLNFAGLFSGTALAPPRRLGVRAQVEF